MSKGPNLMSTQDDPENAPWWQTDGIQLREPLQPPKPNSPIQFYAQTVSPATWHTDVRVALDGISARLAVASLTAHLDIKESNTITPDTGSMAMAPQPVEINVSENVSVQAAGESSSRPSTPQAPDGLEVNLSYSDLEASVGGEDWLEEFSRFIPREFQDDWLGDLREKREQWRTERRSRPYIEWRTGVQIFLLALFKLGAIIGWVLRVYTQLSGWFMHNK